MVAMPRPGSSGSVDCAWRSSPPAITQSEAMYFTILNQLSCSQSLKAFLLVTSRKDERLGEYRSITFISDPTFQQVHSIFPNVQAAMQRCRIQGCGQSMGHPNSR